MGFPDAPLICDPSRDLESTRPLMALWNDLIAGEEAEVELPSVGISLPLAALFERVLPEPACPHNG